MVEKEGIARIGAVHQPRMVREGPMVVGRVTLDGQTVTLRPMTMDDVEQLFEAGKAPDIWRHTATAPVLQVEDMTDYVREALGEEERGESLPFVIVRRADNAITGATRFSNISRADRRLSIGWSWLNPTAHGTGINGEAKALMLRQAFDAWGAIRVEIRADVRNSRSRAAIEGIGGTCEGILRQQLIVRGRVRDTALYSIVDLDWRDPLHRAHRNALRHGINPAATSPLDADPVTIKPR